MAQRQQGARAASASRASRPRRAASPRSKSTFNIDANGIVERVGQGPGHRQGTDRSRSPRRPIFPRKKSTGWCATPRPRPRPTSRKREEAEIRNTASSADLLRPRSRSRRVGDKARRRRSRPRSKSALDRPAQADQRRTALPAEVKEATEKLAAVLVQTGRSELYQADRCF